MLSIDQRDIFKARISGKNVDLGVLAPDQNDYQAVVNEMVEIGMLVRQSELETAYKVNVNFQYDTVGADNEVIELDYEIGAVIGLSSSGNFVFEDARGELFVAQVNNQTEEKTVEGEEGDDQEIDYDSAFAENEKDA